MSENKRKLRGQSMVTTMIGLLVGLILLIAVVVPVVIDTVSDQAFTGTTKTITDLYPLLLVVSGLLLITALFYNR